MKNIVSALIFCSENKTEKTKTKYITDTIQNFNRITENRGLKYDRYKIS